MRKCLRVTAFIVLFAFVGLPLIGNAWEDDTCDACIVAGSGCLFHGSEYNSSPSTSSDDDDDDDDEITFVEVVYSWVKWAQPIVEPLFTTHQYMVQQSEKYMTQYVPCPMWYGY